MLLCAALTALLIVSNPLYAEPTGGNVVSGAANIVQTGPVTDINQSTGKAIINWQGFSIAPQETVNFHQPDVSSVTLNRVIGNESSIIEGALNANGKVFIVNSAGVLFTKGAQVNVGGLVASTLDISNEDFNAGNYTFSGTSTAAVTNQGSLSATQGGYVSLLGKTVSNQGVITATLGTVALASGSKTTLNFGGNSVVDVVIEQGVLNALVENKQLIRADGGQVILTARAADALLAAQVNNTGIVQARTVASLNGGGYSKGRIELKSHGGKANVTGKLDASAPDGGDGGFIETSGDKVKVSDEAVITTKSTTGVSGTWLIDPTDFTIAANGGDMTGAALGNQLNNNSAVTIQSTAGSSGTKGDINVDDAVTWSTDSTLTLTAVHDININNAITATGANAGLVMNYGGDYNIRTPASYAGAELDANGIPVAKQDTSAGVYGSITFTDDANITGLILNGQTYTLIHSLAELDALDGFNAADGSGAVHNVSGFYALAENFDGSGTPYSRSLLGFADLSATPLANYTFGGTLTGLGHIISNLTINAPTQRPVGLIAMSAAGTTIRDIGLVNANVTASGTVGTLLGRGGNATTVSNVYATGSVKATALAVNGTTVTPGNGSNAGGLIGQLQGGSVTDAWADVSILGLANAAGLIGNATNAVITRAHAKGNVALSRSSSGVAGLIGVASNSTVSYTYATGNVAGTGNNFGGLLGQLAGGSLSSSFATGTVDAGSATSLYTAGLLGQASGTTAITNVYATGNVIGHESVGGLIGWNSGTITVSKAFATGNVTGTGITGGFIGNNGAGGLISDAYATGAVVLGQPSAGSGAAGGFVGNNSGTIDRATSSGTVTDVGSGIIGGFAGTNAAVGTITNSHSSGNVSGKATVGGFVGGNAGLIAGSASTGDVAGTRTWIVIEVFGEPGHFITIDLGGIGGFAGFVESTSQIQSSSASGKVNGTGAVGAFVGNGVSGATNENVFWNDEKNDGMGAIGPRLGIDGTSLNDGNRPSFKNARGLNNRQSDIVGRYIDGAGTTEVGATAGATTGAAGGAASASTAATATPPNFDGSLDARGVPAAVTQLPSEDQRRRKSLKGGGAGGDYGAMIKSIDVDGQRFDLEKKDGAPAPTPAGKQ